MTEPDLKMHIDSSGYRIMSHQYICIIHFKTIKVGLNNFLLIMGQ